MRAAIYYGRGDIRVEEYPAPKATNENMIARIECCAICGTDYKTYTVGNPKFVPPIVIGHELVAQIVHVGTRVKGFEVGEYVTMATTIGCGECAYCQKGLTNLCLHTKPISSYYDGAFADYMEIPGHAIAMGNVIKIPDARNVRRYALAEPLSCAVNAQALIGVGQGDDVVILGGGALSALHAELAKANGAQRVFVVTQSRGEWMKRLDGIETIQGGPEEAVERVRAETNGLGADKVIVCAPVARYFDESIHFARKGGWISFFASLPVGAATLALNSRSVHYNELHIVGVSDSRKEHAQRAVDLIAANAVDCEVIITHTVSLNNIVDGLTLMGERRCLKVLVCPGEAQT